MIKSLYYISIISNITMADIIMLFEQEPDRNTVSFSEPARDEASFFVFEH